MHYAAERKMFLGGMLFIDCKKVSSIHQLLKIILNKILRVIDLAQLEKSELMKKICTEDKLKDYLKEFFNRKCKEPLIKQKTKHSTAQAQKSLFLLCFDNIEHILEVDEEDPE